MKKNLTELVFILDRSGSMQGLESDTIGGFNSMLSKQKGLEGTALVTTVLFDDDWTLLHDRIAIDGVKTLTTRDYTVGGRTALLDAIGMTIEKIQSAQRHTAEEERPEKTVFVITTDGQENASHSFSRSKIRQLVQDKQQKDEWEFLFLGANMDAIAAAQDIGIQARNSVRYMSDAQGTEINFDAVSSALEQLRDHQPLSSNWKSSVESDFMSRRR